MARFSYILSLMTAMLLGLPLLGIFLKRLPLIRYLEFPPKTQYIHHAGFSWLVFTGLSLLIIIIIPLLLKGFGKSQQIERRPLKSASYPWWGWLGIFTGLIFWVLAWSRFMWFESFQPYVFTPLWLSFILVINALTYRRKGRCMMTDHPVFFLLLFPASAAFWWFFEYLNRFVQNWYYTGVDFSPLAYFFYATLPFSTVLPAVLGTREWMLLSPRLDTRFKSYLSLRVHHPKIISTVMLWVSGAGLAGIGIWPDFLFPLLWVSPLLIIVSLQALMGERHVLSGIALGDWRLVVSSALAALFCGFFWEMWNYFSLAKWAYSIPFVHRYQIFEMPILGYAGYLPFGLECGVIGGMLARLTSAPPFIDE